MTASVRNTMRSSVPCSTSVDILNEHNVSRLECQQESVKVSGHAWAIAPVMIESAPVDVPLTEPVDSHNRLMGQKASAGLLPGTLDMLILKTLTRGSMHGYSIAEFIQQASHDALRVEEGALYPALHRLELRGLLRSEWGTSDNNRRAKFYRLTAGGRRRLREETQSWNRLATAIGAALSARAQES
jgi:PadR family transcriptional regulator PadR